MQKTFQTGADLGGYLFRITDNGGATADRYTVVFSDGDYLSMSAYPSHPQGISMWGEGLDVAGLSDRVEEGAEVDLSWGCLPVDIRNHVLSRVNQGWSDTLEKIEARDPSVVAACRDDAEENDGLYDTAIKGLYVGADGALWIKATEDQAEDYGPYDDAAHALRMTMPDEYSLSGPEYQSTALGNGGAHSEDADPAILAKVAALEAELEFARNGDEALPEAEGLTFTTKDGERRSYGVWYNFGSNVSYMQRGEDSWRMRLDTTGEIVKPAGSAGDDAISEALYRGEDAETYARFNFGDAFKPKA